MKSVMGRSGRGLTLVEILMGIIIVTILLAVGIPAFYTVLRTSQLDAAARQVISDVREAKSKATLVGWQYRVIGFDKDSVSPFKNQYRLVGRSSAAVAWPVETVENFTSATQMAAQWINVPKVYPGVTLDTSDATNRFHVSFDSRGVAFEINSFPLSVNHTDGKKKCLGITAAGIIRTVTAGCP